MIRISADPIDPREVYDLIARKGAGSVVFHYAVVKEQISAAGATQYIDYGATADTEAELETIAEGLLAEKNITDVLLIRRTGRVGVGEIISLVAASSPNSHDAFAACESGIHRLKKMATIHKSEVCG